ncbi:MAG: hypothetical protein K0S04_3641 [Herbinix sp.]|nr:hypothetical protein [Herbinix sp.]
MIEVMFGESEGGAMKVAKNYHKPNFNNGAIAWIGRKPSKEEFDKMFDGEAVGGNSSEVVCLPFILDIGDISIPIDSEYRKNLILDLYTISGFGDDNTRKSLEDAWNKYLKEIERLKHYASQREDLRLWYSNAPYSLCGFYYVCNLLKDYDCKISAVKLPRYIQLSDNEIQFYSSWGEIDAGKFFRFLPREKALTTCEIRSFASSWMDSQEDKSILRAVVNGKVIGVPEDFYDHVIRKELPEGEFTMGRLIGNILGKYPLGIGDWWYAKRIIRMIELGELVIVQKQKEIYSQILKRQ